MMQHLIEGIAAAKGDIGGPLVNAVCEHDTAMDALGIVDCRERRSRSAQGRPRRRRHDGRPPIA
jgi:hypothetical protein